MNRNRRQLFTLLAILIVGCWLRLWTISKNDLWFDEIFARDLAYYGTSVTLAQGQVIGDTHPPLYYILLNLWIHLAGDSVLALRMLPALLSMLALPAFYHLARLLFNARAAMIAMLLAALSSMQIYYAQESRLYVPAILAAAWTGVGLIALLRGKRYGLAIYIIAAICGLYTHYFMGVLLAVIHVWLLLDPSARRAWRRWLLADVIIGIAFAPQVLLFTRQAGAVLGSFWIAKPNLGAPFTTTPTFLLFGQTLPGFTVILGMVILACVLVISLLDMFRRAPRKIRGYWLFCFGTVFGTLFAVFIISLARSSIYLDKSFALLTPFLIAAIAGSTASARRPSPLPLLTAGLVSLMLIGDVNHFVSPDPAKPPYRQITADILAQPDALSTPILYLHDAAYLPMAYYAPSLLDHSVVVDLGDRSWSYPQSALFPQTWQIFGLQRIARSDVPTMLHGDLRVVVTANLEPPELATLGNLQRTCTTHNMKDYPPFVTVWDFSCPG